MSQFLDTIIFGNTIREYLWVIGIIAFAILLKRIISKYIAIILCKIFRRIWKAFDQQKFIELIIYPLGIFFVVFVSIISLLTLNFPKQINFRIYHYSFSAIIFSIGVAIEIIVFTWLLLRIIDFIASALERRAMRVNDPGDNQLIVFFRDFVKVIIGIIGGLLILRFAFKYNIGNLVTGLSIVGAAIALSLRESLENLIASFVIFFDKPFTTGDTVKVLNITGVVEKIGLRSTRIRSDQKTFVTVPNKQMVDTVLDNQSQRTQQKNELTLQLSLDTPSAKIEELIAKLKAYLATVKEVQNYNVLFSDINVQAYAILIEVFVAAAYVSEFNRIKQQVNLFALKTVEQMEIKIAGKKWNL
ncbi:MAG TPA: mechanosensitive ion channel domain-containing protein [Flavisolibacter sp.]|nr:mechanosensitive ion channel domain-containing protein [Flavisolibacter sp.]